jgi:hypothetical protein
MTPNVQAIQPQTHYFDGDTGIESLTVGSPGSIIYYEYGDPAAPITEGAFTGTPGTRDRPVEIITGYGRKGDSRRIVEIEVYHHHLPPLDAIAPATIYSKGNISINGTSGYISGGGLDLRYDSCMIDDALNSQTGQALRTISWSRIY